MDPALYKAAVEGKIDPFEAQEPRLKHMLTLNENTVLHVYLENQRGEPESTVFVEKILGMCRQILLQGNKKGETPLHFAARYGHSNLVKVLIDSAKALPGDPESRITEAQKMMRLTNGERDTALHVAARNIKSSVVEILTKEDPEFSYPANDLGETPLYIAIATAHSDERKKLIGKILNNCISVDYGGPSGRTALHAAIMRRDDETAIKILKEENDLTKRIELIRRTDQNGWSPLHYAAYFFSKKKTSSVKLLLEYDVSAAYIVDTDKKRTALHIAAIRGNLTTMIQIVSYCPACCELVDNRGWNALHYAVASKKLKVFRECRKIPEFNKLKTEKDDKGNTPYHLLAALLYQQYGKYAEFLGDKSMQSLCGLNKQKLSFEDIRNGNLTEKQQKEILESIEDIGSGPFGRTVDEAKRARSENSKTLLDNAKDAPLVVAALIATVTFAAAFTLPGGYKSERGPDQGTAVLTKEAAFKAFVISDASAMVLSISAVFIHFWMALSPDYDGSNIVLFRFATSLTMGAMGTMMIAFATGTYAVLSTSWVLALTTCYIAFYFFPYVATVTTPKLRRYIGLLTRYI